MNIFWKELPKPFFVLAPMEAVTDVVFRHVVARAGAPDVYFTEFANATGWVHAGDKAIRGRLIKSDDEHPIVAQIWGGEVGDMEAFAKHCAELGFDGIDINMGCPAKSAVKSGGSALIRKPNLAIESITAAKKAGLPVSVKTRLGYTSIDEWRDWLTTLLRQDIVALTVHLRTKKEMSKVPAHHELISEIKKLRNQIAPETLLIINGDIRDRTHGLELVKRYGVDGVMIGRGIFHDPFAFRNREATDGSERHLQPELDQTQGLVDTSRTNPLQPELNKAPGPLLEPGAKPMSEGRDHKTQLINLLRHHLDLYDKYAEQTTRPYDTLKRFYKIYVRDFDGAAEIRDQLMHTNNTDEVRKLLEANNL